MHLQDAKLVFVDVETTGLSPAMGDRIVEVGLVACEPGGKPRQASQLVNPDRPIPPDARRVHGIGDADVAAAPCFEAIARTMGELFHGAWLVGHNIRFDVGFLAMEFALSGFRVEPAGCLDTCQLAATAWELPNYQLDTIAAKLRIQRTASHRALDDALATKEIFDRLVQELGQATKLTIAICDGSMHFRERPSLVISSGPSSMRPTMASTAFLNDLTSPIISLNNDSPE